ncbi:Sensory neuron membrane protein 1, partial [Operophtera brumata]
EWKEKVEIEDHEEDDTITYKKRDTFLFRPDLSGPGLTGEEVGTILAVHRDKPAMLNMVGKALNGIFDSPADVFLRTKVLDILFRGIIMNCAQTDFAPKAVCTQFKKEAVPGMLFEPNNQFRFSLFGTNVMDVGSVVAIDGAPQMNIWRDSCNEYQGTDGTVFPPFLTMNDRLQSFKPWYQKKTSYSGIRTNRYIANIGDFANDPELQCFCKEPTACPPKGLMDLSSCVGAPLYASLPHFLDCDPEVMNKISGTPMVAKQRVQFNMELLRTEKLGLALNKTFVKMLKNQLFIPKRIVSVLRWWLIALGSLGAMVSMLHFYKGNNNMYENFGKNIS